MISTRDLSGLPDVFRLQKIFQSLATLDSILSRDWEYRYYSFNSKWDTDEQMGSMRNGQGDELFALFNKTGCFIKGFDHESPMSPYRDVGKKVWDGVMDKVPQEFFECLTEPALNIKDTTFCIWRRKNDDHWQRGSIAFPEGKDPDGSVYLLTLLNGNPETYQAWAEEYYEMEISLEAVRKIFEHVPMHVALVKALNADVSLEDLNEDLREIGYPR